jgi:hypothetical protein
MQPGPFDDVIVPWLGRLTSAETPPRSIVAFNVGLFETEEGFTAYLAGADRYDPNDADWACDETFTPRERYVVLPVRRGEGAWQQVQDLVADAIRRFLASRDGAASFLAKAQAVTVGFDDGDLVRVK